MGLADWDGCDSLQLELPLAVLGPLRLPALLLGALFLMMPAASVHCSTYVDTLGLDGLS